MSIALAHAYIAVAAIGMSMVIITGNIDISVGSLIGVLAAVCGTLANMGLPIGLAWLLPILLAIVISGSLGVLVAYCRIPSIVASLGYLSILKGGLIIWTGGAWITDLPENFGLALQRWGGVPAPIWAMLILTALAAYWMRNSRTGRAFYAIGGNAEAARLAGIPTQRMVVLVFMLNGLFAGIAGILFATQLKVIQTTVPPYLELTIITAAVVGGVSILGGTGTVIGSTLAAVLLAAIGSALIFIDVSPFWLRATYGTLILVTVLFDLHRRRLQQRAS
ncbi:MAG: ABC transporter permease [Betaproteobacteria bacterium AqS2]|uniref:Autoinducer 2 import system permease protein LsrC n=1 Tax=Candidatus Amphirhobacter heronislandensis TaxID=1732024 RepID=A0A930UHI8_9GAMM|nr:ABC transporter permease [Betaproteobacteria bacterium AqS2]